MIFWFFVPPTRADFSVEKRKRSFFHSHFHLMGKTVFWIWYPGYPDLISWIRGQHNIFIFRAKNKKVLPGGRGLAESTPARVLCVEFRQEVAFWQPLGWWREPTQRGRQSPRLETARPQMVSLSGQSSAPPPLPTPQASAYMGKTLRSLGDTPISMSFLLFAEKEMWLMRQKQYLPQGLSCLSQQVIMWIKGANASINKTIK